MERLIGGRGAPPAHPTGIIGATISEGTVLAVGATGVTFTAPHFDGNIAQFGPAPWARALVTDPEVGLLAPVPPNSGDRVLVIWVGGFPNRPWVVAWWPAA